MYIILNKFAPKIFNLVFFKNTMFKFFTANQANDALPDLMMKFDYALTRKNDFTKIEKELQLSMSTTDSFEKYMVLKQQLNSAITKFYQSIEILESTGVMIKSIEQGLLDFPSKRFDEEVCLCWKHGETEIKFWHERDSGFMGRKPIEVNDESLI